MREKLEVVPDVGPDILSLVHQFVKKRNQFHQLIVWFIHKPRLYGDTILKLVSKSLKHDL